MKKINITVSLMILCLAGSGDLFGVKGGHSGGRGYRSGGGARSMGSRSVSRSVSGARARTVSSTRSVSQARVASPRVSRQTTTRQVTRRPAGRQVATTRQVSRSGTRGGRWERRHDGRRYDGKRRHGGRRHHRYYPRHRYAFWLGFPLAWQYYYTPFDNSCVVFNDTATEITIYTPSTPRLTVPAGEFLYLPCGQVATIVSPRGQITSNVYDRMSVVDTDAGIVVD